MGKPGRVLVLVTKLSQKLGRVKWSEFNRRDVKEKFFTMGRMMKAYVKGEYRQIPWKPLLLIAAAVIYFVNPIDLIPDWIPGLGLTDDLGILLTVYNAVGHEIEKFIAWEKATGIEKTI